MNDTKGKCIESLEGIELGVWSYISKQINDLNVKARVQAAIEDEGISKRLWYHFITLFADETRLGYYWNESSRLLDSSPFAGAKFIEPFRMYTVKKAKRGISTYLSPFARGTAALDVDTEQTYSLTQWHFFLWLDKIGGIVAMYKYLPEIQRDYNARLGNKSL